MYYGLAPEARVVHLLGEPSETRHLLVANEQAVIEPSWSIHSGAGTSSYSFGGSGGRSWPARALGPVAIGGPRASALGAVGARAPWAPRRKQPPRCWSGNRMLLRAALAPWSVLNLHPQTVSALRTPKPPPTLDTKTPQPRPQCGACAGRTARCPTWSPWPWPPCADSTTQFPVTRPRVTRRRAASGTS
jgi:hypothetical protein